MYKVFPLEHTALFVPAAAADGDDKGDVEKLLGKLASNLTAKGIEGFDSDPFFTASILRVYFKLRKTTK